MNTPESTPSQSEAIVGPKEFTVEEYAALLKKSADHLARIANHKLVSDSSLISTPVRRILDTSLKDLANELSQPKDAADSDDEDDNGYPIPY